MTFQCPGQPPSARRVISIYSSGIPCCRSHDDGARGVGVISQLAKQNSALIIRAGTVFDVETAQQCLDAGVAFLTTPGLDLEIVNFAVKHGTMVFPGALTRGEVMAASKAGADFVKIFPSAQLGGPG